MTDDRHNPYRSPDAPIVESTPVTDEELGAFAPASGDYYLRVFSRHRSDRLPRWRPNLSALFYGPFWCFYRRLYGLGAGVFGILTVAQYALHGGTVPPCVDPASTLVGLGVSLPLSLCANPLYYQHALRSIEAARRTSDDRVLQLEAIRRAGGAHESWLTVAMVVSLVCLACSLLHLAWIIVQPPAAG